MNRRVVLIEDAWTDPLYEKKEDAKIGGVHSMIGVPLMREGQPIGVMGLARTRVDPFAQREIDLVTTFADQAAIAIENVRLFEAEQQRTSELTESLQQQTATADVLKIISRSTFDLQTVLDTLVQSAARLCDADTVVIGQPKGKLSTTKRAMDTPGNTASSSQVAQLGSTAEQLLGAPSLNAKSFISSTFWPIPNTRIP